MWAGDFVVYSTPIAAFFAWVLMLFPFLGPYPIKLSPLLVVRPAVSSTVSELPAAKFGLFGEHSDNPPFAQIDLYQVLVYRPIPIRTPTAL